ncbi:hypothetical protein [Alkalimarinus alittae]|uniref:Uncharacterized protein n=1 Tax=Alkalimarinus alittae TaxID=2961619 RepID=A0ABY6N0Z4_9ALTE|nr:hypothetical protein [Alkalimarinus alittae]UZE95677.1 hypothetical protein NKI27_16690 [Alkalimarinus alittae]
MKFQHPPQTCTTFLLTATFISSLLLTSTVTAIDLNYNPEFDAPSSDKTGMPSTRQFNTQKHLSEERKSTTKNDTNRLKLNPQHQDITPVKGWSFKAPSLSSDKAPSFTDERQSVKMSEQQMWQEGGKNYDNNPLNQNNYRVNVEAELTF